MIGHGQIEGFAEKYGMEYRRARLDEVPNAGLIAALDTTVLNVAIPTILRDLNTTLPSLQWVITAYAIFFGGVLLLGDPGDGVAHERQRAGPHMAAHARHHSGEGEDGDERAGIDAEHVGRAAAPPESHAPVLVAIRAQDAEEAREEQLERTQREIEKSRNELAGVIPDAEITATDLNEAMVELCRTKGLQASRADALPREDTGKIFKRKLKEPFWKGVGRSI